MTTEHSLLGASSAHRWLNCPGSFKLSQTAPHRRSSIYAATGTLAHSYIEQAVANGSWACDESDLGQQVLAEDHTIDIDQGLIDGVNVMLDYLRGAQALSDWADVEFRVDLGSYFKASPVPVFGTVDAAAHTWATETLEVVDYKNGAGVAVSPVENPQLMFYAAGVLGQLEVARDRVKTVRLTIVQPNAGGAPVRSWDLDVIDLLMWVDDVLVPGVEACAQDDAPLNPGSWCRFCPVAHACPQLHQDAVEMAKHEFDDYIDGAGYAGFELARILETAERANSGSTGYGTCDRSTPAPGAYPRLGPGPTRRGAASGFTPIPISPSSLPGWGRKRRDLGRPGSGRRPNSKSGFTVPARAG